MMQEKSNHHIYFPNNGLIIMVIFWVDFPHLYTSPKVIFLNTVRQFVHYFSVIDFHFHATYIRNINI